MFDGKYLEWNQKRIKAIIDFYGHKFMYYKKVLDLGCGYADISGVLHRLGADITALDARQEHLKVVGKKYPGIKTVKADLDRGWPFNGKLFNVILDLDLINHLADFESHLRAVCSSCTNLVLECAVCDSEDASRSIITQENKNIYDLSVNGVSCYPSAAAIERVIRDCGMNFKRLDIAKLNSGSYVYDWQSVNNGAYDANKRRMWFAVKNSSPMQFSNNNDIQQINPPPLPPTVGHVPILHETGVLLDQAHIINPDPPKNTTQSVFTDNAAPLRVAVCISGHLRTFENNYPSIKEHLLNKFDCDVFIHTWDILGLSYRHTDGNLHAIETDRLMDKINHLYKPKKLIIESHANKKFIETRLMKERLIDHRDIPGILSMYYKVEACNELKKNYERENNFKYGFVIRFRGDLYLEQDIPLNKDTHQNYLFLPTYGNFGGFNDQFAFGGSHVMDVYSSLYSNIEKYLSVGAPMHPEKLLKYHIDSNNLAVAKTNIKYLIKRANGLVQDNMLLEKALGFIR